MSGRFKNLFLHYVGLKTKIIWIPFADKINEIFEKKK